MPFLTGRVSYTRLRVTGQPPTGEAELLDALEKHAFTESPAPRIGVMESGFTTGVHLLDKSFSYEKNIFGACAHFALRVDSHQVPGDMKKALRVQHEQWAAKASAKGFISRADKADAQDAASREIDEQLKNGKFRKSKMVPILWNFTTGLIYCASSSGPVIEELAKKMREAFSVKLQPISAGVLAAEMCGPMGINAKYFEDLRPSAFTPPPAVPQDGDAAEKQDRNIPGVPWVAKARDLRDFLGNEFLIWLLWNSQNGAIHTPDAHAVGTVSLTPWKSLDLECAWGVTGKTTIRVGASGDEGGSPIMAPAFGRSMNQGQWPRKAGMMLSNKENGYEFALQGDQMDVSGLNLPAPDDIQSERELSDARIRLLLDFDRTLDATFAAFLRERCSPNWIETVELINLWIQKKGI